MTTVGIFAGRGDVIIAMCLAVVCGGWAGWQLKSLQTWFKSKFKKNPQ